MKREAALVATVCSIAFACAPKPALSPSPVRTQQVTTLVRANPQDAGMRADLGATLDSIVKVALAEHAAPGASLAVGRYGRMVHIKGYGRLDTAQASPLVDENSIYDMASL